MRKGMLVSLSAIAATAFLAACSSDDSSATEPANFAETQLSSSSDEGSKPADKNFSDSSSSFTESEPSSSTEVPNNHEYSSATSSSNTRPASSSSAIELSESSSSEASPESSYSSWTATNSSSSLENVESSSSPYLWNDEFDGTAIDASKWTFETGATGWGNNEWQNYTARSENAYVQDGILHIRANKERYESSDYTSARIITKGKFSFTYGTVEARIALPVGKGIWPAFWMLGENIDDVSWPACGETDIIETVNDENIVYGTNHWAYEGNHVEYGNKTNDYYGTSLTLDITQFHTYKLIWNEKTIAMYVDDFKYHEISIELDANGKSAGGTDAFHKPFFFILNVAVAGNWPGFEVDDSQFPNEMLVDYIRVYR
jgi:hypothetical protein